MSPVSPTSPPPRGGTVAPVQKPETSWSRWMVRVVGIGLLLAALVPFWESLRALDHRDYVSSLLAGFVGWFISQAGIELVRPESAE